MKMTRTTEVVSNDSDLYMNSCSKAFTPKTVIIHQGISLLGLNHFQDVSLGLFLHSEIICNSNWTEWS